LVGGRLGVAVLALVSLGCLLGPVAIASAAPARAGAPGFSPQVLLAKLAVQQAELTAGDGFAGDVLGVSVAISGDTALVGAPMHATAAAGKDFAGAAYVFTRSGGVWTQQAELAAADGAAGDEFGSSVSLSGDTALVGAPLRDGSRDPFGNPGLRDTGAAYVFTRSGGVWTQQAELTAADGAAGDQFGAAVAVSGDAALVGAPSRKSLAGGIVDGGAYVFSRSGGSWAQQQQLIAANSAAYYFFGISVALTGDTALVGATKSHDSLGAPGGGAVWVFVRPGTAPPAPAWVEQAKLTAANGAAGDEFGVSVAASGDTALVGAHRRDTSGMFQAGAAYVFVRAGGSWAQQAELTASDGAIGDLFGVSVSLAGDTALVGALYHDAGGKLDAGAAYVFERAGGSWTQQQMLAAADGVGGDEFGASVAVSADTALVGAPFHDIAGQLDVGAAYVFGRVPTILSFLPGSGPVGTHVTVSGAGFAGASVVTFNRAPAAFTVDSDVQITAIVPAGATSGLIAVTTPGGTGVGVGAFTVIPAPAIARLSPTSGRRGATVTISGTGFGGARGSGTATFGGRTCTKYLSWSDAQIVCRVPAKAKYGHVAVTVTTAGGVSNGKGFRVKR
jgi:hypothetical protein